MIELCREIYLKELDRFARQVASEQGGWNGVEVPKPSDIPEAVWSELSPPGRTVAFVRRWSRKFVGNLGRVGERYPLSCSEFLQMAYPELRLSPQAAACTVALLESCRGVRRNPTIRDLAAAADAACSTGEPLELCMSQCLKKSAVIRPLKLNYFLERDTNCQEVRRFVEGIEIMGWERLRDLMRRFPGSVRATIYLGDMDLLTIDGGSRWLKQSARSVYEAEMRLLLSQIQVRAGEFFGPLSVTVGRWSEQYDLARFSDAIEKAAAFRGWSESRLMRDAERMYLGQWGYRRLAQSLGIPSEQMIRFISGDIIRTAAQYNLEGTIIRRRRAIQVWAEKVPDRWWPAEISNYDGSLQVGSISLI